MTAFWLTILILFVATALGTVLQRRAKDPCLKKLHGRPVFLKLKEGRWVWGRLHVYAKSLELVFDQPNPDSAGHAELSYVLFEDMLPHVHILLHPAPRPGMLEFRLWKKNLDRLITPSLLQQLRRSCRNVYNTLRDAFSQSVGILVGVLRARNPVAALAPADQKLTSVGQMLVAAGNSYEPILENYLGREVVAEILEGERWIEHVGVLEEYSDRYLLMRDVRLRVEDQALRGQNLGEWFDVVFPRAHSVIRHLALRKKTA